MRTRKREDDVSFSDLGGEDGVVPEIKEVVGVVVVAAADSKAKVGMVFVQVISIVMGQTWKSGRSGGVCEMDDDGGMNWEFWENPGMGNHGIDGRQ